MTVELNPVGVACNLACTYCYEDPMRLAGNINTKWDWEAVKAALDEENQPFILFGGEPLLLPMGRLEKVLRYGFLKWKQTSIQTNGSLLTDEHLRLFTKCNTHVGISLDGPGELSLSRWAGSREKTLELAKLSDYWLKKLIRAKMGVSLIVTLWKGNCSPDEHFVKLANWFTELDSLGLRSARLHFLEIDDPRAASMRIDDGLLTARLLDLAHLERKFKNLRFDIFDEMRKLLTKPESDLTCVWSPCDPYTTHAVHGIAADGTRSNCGRTNKDGINWVKADVTSHERQLALYQTPQEFGGCKGCRFFVMCKGQCPGTALSGDWRNKTEHCLTLQTLFEYFEDEVENPVSRSTRLASIESKLLENLRGVLRGEQSHGDSHGDVPHGDSHGDSNQRILLKTVVPVKQITQ